ncbi:hypothetical protein CDN99_19045 [Roseateles aquatilis]|uniref:Uncharacterized protein n=1 Tax=Roseateles aquatilis TaxID=431061 RepID=A0A246J2L1_9BURK|nr:hypothetical protein [Roseateles aquatilis]OWQ86815.1 hypothetical protein CDN99_19045 [Roseateles aquatilis]
MLRFNQNGRAGRARSMLRALGLVAGLMGALVPASRSQTDPGYDWSVVGARVTSMEVTYMPDRILFAIESNVGSCGAGTWLTYEGSQGDTAMRHANVKAVYAALVAAKVGGTTIRAYGRNAGCKAIFFYLG